MKIFAGYITTFFSLFSLLSCGKEGCNVIPDARVNISISQGAHINLTAHGNYVYFLDQGYAGVVLVNSKGTVSALDLCSTINPNQRNRVVIVDQAYFVDHENGAKWLLDGSPAAIAECPLKIYAVTSSNNGFTYDVHY